MAFKGNKFRAHRVVYIALRGGLPIHRDVDHLCHNRRCCNPDHLEAVTHRVNVLRGACFAARHFAKTHCKKGHPFNVANTRIERGKYRRCRICDAEWARNRRRAAKGEFIALPKEPTMEEPASFVGAERVEKSELRQADLQANAVDLRGASKTHCKHGHPFSPESTHIDPRGHRRCRECNRENLRRAAQRKRALKDPSQQDLNFGSDAAA
jgi:hypothetical protein